MFVSAIIAAGGRGLRLGGAQPKQLVAIGGRPILERSVRTFLMHPLIDEVIVALPEDLAADPPAYLRSSAKPLQIVAGGPRRQDSVARAFQVISPRTEIVVIHDAARPFVSPALIERTIGAAASEGAAVAALPARDTVKLAEEGEDGGRGQVGFHVLKTLRRERVFLAQTPQAFRKGILSDALIPGEDATDEATLVERAGHRVQLVEGEASNIKITTPEDLELADAIARSLKPARTGRAGIGYDLHRLVEGRPLILGGVAIPFEKGLWGHSDADAICHALTDAILGAAGAGDIGAHFPDTDARWSGASSLMLLEKTAAIVGAQGLEVGNVDVTVVAERPKLAPYIETMRANIAGALGIAVGLVSIKGKTNEGVDAIGRGEAIAVHAIALLRSR
jgi:2-C-methyl-D-erythritol 4-phosphate cytidylyltransferase/2-C-methyl-D-erythritol 2,4-cyclodiphosphate synthase